MPLRVVFTACVLCFAFFACAKSGLPVHESYAAKYWYADSLLTALAAGDKDGFSRSHFAEIERAFALREQEAAKEGDAELARELKMAGMAPGLKANFITLTDAESVYAAIADDARKEKLSCQEAEALQRLGELYAANGRQNDGFEYFLSAYVIYAPFAVAKFPAKENFLFSLGSSYYSYGDNENALHFIKEAVELPGFKLKVGFTKYNTIGLSYRNMGRYDSAEWYFRAIYNEARSIADTLWASIAMGNIGITYYYQKRYAEAIPVLQEDIRASMEHKVVKNAVGSMLILGSLYYEQREMVKAEQILLDAVNISHEHVFWYDFALAEKLYTKLFRVYEARHNPAVAVLYADSALQAKDSNIVKNNALQYVKKQEKIDMRQRRLASKQLSEQKEINFYLAIVSVLLLLIGALAYLNQRMTAKLNKQIISQKKEVEQLNEVKDRLFNVISHDMRTPVNSLIAFTELLDRGNISEAKMAAYAAALKNNLSYTARLLENLLNWARTQMQGFKPVFEVFSLMEAMGQVMELVQHEADKKGVTITILAPRDLLVYADMNMFSLLLRNLLGNAIKYTPAGGTVTVSSSVVGSNVQIKITDTGVGIAPGLVADLNNVKTARPVEATPGTNHEKGTGLGLMLCRTFIELMHGKLVLESAPDKGTTVIVEVPSGNER